MKIARLRELAVIFLRLGATAFGGPLAHVALMRREFVEQRQWFTAQEFLDMFGAVNLVPGPSSTQLAMYVGQRRAGGVGLFVAGCAFIAPAMLMVLLLAAVYHRFGAWPASQAIFAGVAPVVVAIIVVALAGLLRTSLRGPLPIIVALLSLVAQVKGYGPLLVIAGAVAVGMVAALLVEQPSGRTPSLSQNRLLLALPWGAKAGGIVGTFWTFLKLGSVVFGSGYVLISYLNSELVVRQHAISRRQLLDAIAVGQMTPGPVFTTATFLGYQIAGISGAIAATVGIFAPSFLFVTLLAHLLRGGAESHPLRAFLQPVNAASLALLAWVAGQMAWGVVWYRSHFELVATAWGLAALAVLLRSKLNPAWLLALGAAGGWLSVLLHR